MTTETLATKYLKFIKTYWLHLILIFVVGGLTYSAIHEFVHIYIANSLGYMTSVTWWYTLPIVNLDLSKIPVNHYFLIAISPYVISLMLLATFVTLFLTLKNKIFFYFSIIPAADTIVNLIAVPIAILTHKPNDFLNLFKIGYGLPASLVAISIIAIFILMIKFRKR